MDSSSAIQPCDSDPPGPIGADNSSSVSSLTAVGDSSQPDSPANSQSLLRTLYSPIVRPLRRVEQRLHLELQNKHPLLSGLLRHGTNLGGKRLRPAMLLLVAKATGTVNEEHVVLATVVEMVHTATLVHDDVLDGADTRRHLPTINSKWSDHTSILLGDYLFAQSFYLAATLPSTEACRWIGQAARLVCEGELRQVLQRNAFDLDEATYIDLIRGKTAELCRVACQLGAKFSGADESSVRMLGQFGDAIGIAFQIADDYLDLWGEDGTIGKTLGTDICQGKMTLPLIRMMQTASATERTQIQHILKGPSQQRLNLIRPWLENSDARQYTRQVAQSYCDRAIRSLSGLSDSAAARSLKAMAEFSVDRRF